jgi:hypothetical protein
VSDLTVRTPKAIAEAMELVQADDLPIEDRAALYGFLYELQRRINRSLGIRQKGRTAQHELTEYLDRTGLQDLGPLYLAWEAFDVKYPCNAAENWTDDGVQQALAALYLDQTTRPWVRLVPQHFEIDVAALGADVHAGSRRAIEVFRELKDKKWRTEAGKKPVLKVREPKRKKAAA